MHQLLHVYLYICKHHPPTKDGHHPLLRDNSGINTNWDWIDIVQRDGGATGSESIIISWRFFVWWSLFYYSKEGTEDDIVADCVDVLDSDSISTTATDGYIQMDMWRRGCGRLVWAINRLHWRRRSSSFAIFAHMMCMFCCDGTGRTVDRRSHHTE